MLRRLLFVILIALLVSAVLADEHEGHTLILTNGVIIDGTGADPIEGSWLVISDGLITDIIDDPTVYDPPAEAQILDMEGATILPGIINSHSHFSEDPQVRRDEFLLKGVTSICNLATVLDGMDFLALMETEDGLPTARGLMSGPMITVAGGYPEPNWGSGNYNISGPEEAAPAVEDLLSRGASFIKIPLEPGNPADPWPVLTLEELKAVTDATHEQGTVVIAHVEDLGFLERAIEGGVDIITHTPHRWTNEEGERFQPFVGEEENPELAPEYLELLQRMVDEEIMLMPTLDALTGRNRSNNLRHNGMVQAVRTFYELGGQFAIGNDWPLVEMPGGVPFGDMDLLTEAGLTPMELIVAGTQGSAYACGHAHDLGTLEVGKIADVLVVDGDPLEDYRNLENVRMVILDGVIVADNS